MGANPKLTLIARVEIFLIFKIEISRENDWEKGSGGLSPATNKGTFPGLELEITLLALISAELAF